MLKTSGTSTAKILDFDIETVAAGFADPNWVPQRVTCIAWSWIGQERIHCRTRLDGPVNMFAPFLAAYDAADMVTGHNLIRFDLPVINADLMRLRMATLGPKVVQDTIRMKRSKGFKKGQDNIGELLEIANKKLDLSWQGWDDAYEWDRLIQGKKVTWKTVIDRCKSDVAMHKQMRDSMLEAGWLKRPARWSP